jgi:asparagine synthase (glutamine-hydrolysing)
MGAILGILGTGSVEEVRAMAMRMPYRGAHVNAWSPAQGVYLGEMCHWPLAEDPASLLAADLLLDLDWRKVSTPETYLNRESRDRHSRLHLLERLHEHKAAAMSSLAGLFAFAYWDPIDQSLLLATDRNNYHRIYHVALPGRRAFASEYKALLALDDCPAEPNRDAIQYYLATRDTVLHASCLAGVQSVCQGRYLTMRHGQVSMSSSWSKAAHPVHRSAGSHARQLRETLLATAARLVAPYPRIGITLSGGLDSAGLLALVRHASPDTTVATYTIGYGEEDPEIQGARIAASYFGTEHHELIFDPSSMTTDLSKLVWLMEQTTGREESLLQFQVESHMATRESVVMGGHGADMVFAGMPRHRLIRLAELVPFARRGAMELFQQTQTGILPQSICGRALSQLVYRGKATTPPAVIGSSGPTIVPEPPSLEAYISDTIVDMTSMLYHSATHDVGQMQALFPYLSNDVIDLSLTIPAGMKAGPRTQKKILREALHPLLPAGILKRGKAIQRVRHDTLLSDILDSMADELLSPSTLRHRGLIDPAYLGRIRRRQHNKAYSSEQLYPLWALVVTEIWCRHFLDNRGKPWGFNPGDVTSRSQAR